MDKAKRCFRAQVQPGGTLELLVYEEIGEDPWSGRGVTAKGIKQQLDQSAAYSRIAMRINSPGGDAFEGVAIMNLLKSQGIVVDVYVDGIAASAASIVAMAGKSITMGKASMMMVHNPWTVCMGNAGDMRKCAETLDVIATSIGEAYIQRTGKTAAKVKAIMDAETWMGAQQCLDEGFATAIADDDGSEPLALAKSFRSLSRLKNVPEALKQSNLSLYEARLTLAELGIA